MGRRGEHKKPRAGIAIVALFGALGIGGMLPVAADDGSNATQPHTQAQSTSFDPAVESLLEQQAPLLRDRWAGTSPQPDGTVVVGLTAGPTPGALQHPKVRVVTRRFTTTRLSAVVETVTVRLNPLLNPGVEPGTPGKWPYSADAKVDENIVVVELDPSREDQRSLVETALADEIAAGTVRIEIAEQPEVTPACASRTDCSQPFRGGTRVYGVNPPEGSCTLNFPVHDSVGVRFQATASHCAGTPWRHAGRDIGGTVWTEDSGNHDYKVIRQNNENERAPQNFIYRAGQTATPITIKLVTPSNGYQIFVCQEGSFGNQGCGTVTSWSTTWNGRGGFGKVSSLSYGCRGDSGAPIYNPANLRAYGVTTGMEVSSSGDCGPARDMWFTWTVNAENASGYQLLLSDTTRALGPGQAMFGGVRDKIRSSNGLYTFVQQEDGNLVLYGPTGAVWASGTQNNPGAFTVLQNDGNLVVYKPGRSGVLRAYPGNANRRAGARLVLQDDRNVVLYGPDGTVTWATWTQL